MRATVRPPSPALALLLLTSVLVLGAAVPAAAELPAAVQDELSSARAPASQLEPSGSVTSLRTRFFRFQQEVDGVPVIGAEAVVADARDGGGDLLADRTRRDVEAPPTASVPRAAAVERARAGVALRELRDEIRAEQEILPDVAGGRLVWRVLVPAAKPLGSFELLVDARSGELVRKRDLLVHEQGTAALFLPNAVVANGGWSPALVDDGDQDSELLTSLRQEVTLERLGAGDCLEGDYVRATVPPFATGACAPGRDFNSLTRSDSRFEAAMAYFHIDRTQAYIRELGFRPSSGNGVNARQTRADVNSIPDDNSYYDPLTRRIALGEGGVDDAEDGDVVVHEYGHAVQGDQVGFIGSAGEPGAMAEGFADYLAATMASRLPTATAAFNACMFEWDTWGGPTRRPCLRRVDRSITADTAERTCPPDPHCVGEAWSGALWNLRSRLGRDRLGRAIMDVLTLQSHFYLTSSASFDDGSRALIFADRAAYRGAHEGVLRDVLSERALLDPRRFERRLTIDYAKRAEAFSGRLSAEEHRCRSDQEVELLRKRDGADKRLGSVRTGGDGRWRLDRSARDASYYAKAPRSSVRPDTCLGARSRTVEP